MPEDTTTVTVNFNLNEVSTRIAEAIMGMKRPHPDPNECMAALPADTREIMLEAGRSVLDYAISVFTRDMGLTLSEARQIDTPLRPSGTTLQ